MPKYKVVAKYVSFGEAIIEAESANDACSLVELEDVELMDVGGDYISIETCEQVDE